jgi:hypothetical protein
MAGKALNPSSCVEFLGHLISDEGFQPNPRKIKTIVDWSIPKDKTKVRSFLGLASYY